MNQYTVFIPWLCIGFISCLPLLIETVIRRIANRIANTVNNRRLYKSMNRYYRTWY